MSQEDKELNRMWIEQYELGNIDGMVAVQAQTYTTLGWYDDEES